MKNIEIKILITTLAISVDIVGASLNADNIIQTEIRGSK